MFQKRYNRKMSFPEIFTTILILIFLLVLMAQSGIAAKHLRRKGEEKKPKNQED